MHRISKLTFALSEQSCIARRCFSITNSTLVWNPISYAQNRDLGAQSFRVFAVKALLDQQADVPASKINDIVSGLTFDNHIFWKVKNLKLLQTAENTNDVLAKIGELKGENKDSAVTEIFDELNKNCFSSLTDQDISTLIKSQHPRFLLRLFCDTENIKLYTETKRKDNGDYEAFIYFGGEVISTVTNEKECIAEHLACLSAIKTRFLEQYYEVSLDDFNDIPLEEDVDIGKGHKQRTVTVTKLPDEEFGFTIRGGQQKLIKDKEFVQLNIISPIIVSHVNEESPAAAAGIRRGDLLLGVNDYSTCNKSHEQVVVILKKFVNCEEVSLTVHYNKHELLKYEAEQNILERELIRVKDEVESEHFKKWHAGKSKKDPLEYFMGKFAEKPYKYRYVEGGQKNRLWHKYKPIKKPHKY